ncbi:phosphotransferase [Cognatiyoonia sp. IB215446]|uniref:aminoglycoside phosphotransferase family protein n=1 Tax=Cognatiyoonia sp. IB215446 TaxID=3097355 RepID=UPI002A0E4478|nr:phosphotransferase [Cognatiyoonia sp. IB215446]MDX8350546.1 phosphotransferase [Cognatiyoonia sp. IB215446]
MSAREEQINAFLQATEWREWQRAPLAGDASTRRYERLSSGANSVILMDAPSGSGATTTEFADLAAALQDFKLCPPAILAHDPVLGAMVISDLGRDDFALWLAKRPEDAEMLYRAAIDVLLHLRQQMPPADLSVMTPEIGAAMVGLAGEHYAGRPADDLISEMARALERLAPHADTLALRDYHAENLIWRPGLSGLARVGLLDFQDAFVAPEGYDLVSLLRDARRDVPPALVTRMVAYYMDKTNADQGFHAQLACLGAQRNLRILGVFPRLAKQMRKPKYLALIPRVWANLQLDLAHPALAELRRVADATLPSPTDAFLEGLQP